MPEWGLESWKGGARFEICGEDPKPCATRSRTLPITAAVKISVRATAYPLCLSVIYHDAAGAAVFFSHKCARAGRQSVDKKQKRPLAVRDWAVGPERGGARWIFWKPKRRTNEWVGDDEIGEEDAVDGDEMHPCGDTRHSCRDGQRTSSPHMLFFAGRLRLAVRTKGEILLRFLLSGVRGPRFPVFWAPSTGSWACWAIVTDSSSLCIVRSK